MRWLLALALVGVLLAWWAASRRAGHLQRETERLSRHQRYLASAHGRLQKKSEDLRRLSMHDPLTGTLNRHAFAEELGDRIQRLSRYSQPISLIMFDLDHFKTINDRLGHLVGDAALALVVGVVREHLVSDDLFGRFGGDEFMIACVGQPISHAAAVAERIRAAVARRAPLAEPAIPGLTLSLGVAQADATFGYAVDALFARADEALYEAKRQGRNSVATAGDVAPLARATDTARDLRRHL